MATPEDTQGWNSGTHVRPHTPTTPERMYRFFRPCVSQANQLSEAGAAAAAAAEDTRAHTHALQGYYVYGLWN